MPWRFTLRGSLSLLIALFTTVATHRPAVGAAQEPHYTLAFASYAPYNADIYAADGDGRNARPLVVHPDLDYNPTLSRDGKWVVFTSTRSGSADIYRVHMDGSGLERLTYAPGNDAHSAWSPDGEWIAFASARGGFRDESALTPNNPQSYADIYVMRADGTDVRRVTDNQFEEGSPAWSSAQQ